MRRMISVPLILAAAAALSFLPVQDCLAMAGRQLVL